MTLPYRRVVVTGAGGFIGARLVRRLLADPAVRDRLIDGGADLVFHLAGVLGGAAEADPAAARRVNIDATLSLFEALHAPDRPPRVVFSSSIAVFGPSDGAPVDDATEARPTLIYGAQKRMMEIALDQMSARGWIDGIALRLPGVVARPGADARCRAHAIPCDLGDGDQVRSLARDALAKAGRIDVLICNGGMEGHVGPIGEATDSAIDTLFAVNLRSAMTLTAEVTPGMAERGSGSVVLVASIAGLRGNKAIGLYGVAKAGLAQLARNLAVEWGPSGVRRAS